MQHGLYKHTEYHKCKGDYMIKEDPNDDMGVVTKRLDTNVIQRSTIVK